MNTTQNLRNISDNQIFIINTIISIYNNLTRGAYAVRTLRREAVFQQILDATIAVLPHVKWCERELPPGYARFENDRAFLAYQVAADLLAALNALLAGDKVEIENRAFAVAQKLRGEDFQALRNMLLDARRDSKAEPKPGSDVMENYIKAINIMLLAFNGMQEATDVPPVATEKDLEWIEGILYQHISSQVSQFGKLKPQERRACVWAQHIRLASLRLEFGRHQEFIEAGHDIATQLELEGLNDAAEEIRNLIGEPQ